MIDTSSLTVLVLAALVLLATPGPAVLYIVARSVDQGRRAGIVSTLGIGTGTLIHVFAATIGVSALLAASAVAFSVVKFLGAGYLIFLGLRRIFGRGEAKDATEVRKSGLRRIFWQGFLVNLLNPKTALFFFAFLPQFVDVSLGHLPLQVVILGTLFVLMSILSDGVYAMLDGTLGQHLRRNVCFLSAERYIGGGGLIALGVTTALSGSSKS